MSSRAGRPATAHSPAGRELPGRRLLRPVLAAQLLVLAGLLTVAVVARAVAPPTPRPALRVATGWTPPPAASTPRLAALPPGVYPLVHPLRTGEVRLIGRFGDPRSGGRRSHEGVDLGAAKLTPVVAAADGVVTWIHGPRGPQCCDLALLHDDGWSSRYIHLNNDTPGTDDGRGSGIRPGLGVGDAVRAGDLLGWVGDSGNAEATPPHLHFELRDRNGLPLDPSPSLQRAVVVPTGPP